MQKKQTFNGIGSAAVEAKTGKNWPEWFDTLDKLGAREMPHKDIAQMLAGDGLIASGWWRQMVTVGYEQFIGRRIKNQACGGFQVSVSKTVDKPVRDLYRLWASPERRAEWLKRAHEERTKAANKRIRLRFPDGSTVEAHFYPKKSGTQLAIDHQGLKGQSDAEKMRAFWRAKLNAM